MIIQKLPQHLINKLKAGEIVERPASVVKELIENSIDAGANNIIVEIEDGGKKLIKIVDDGKGIGKQDLNNAIDRYSTSKISNEEDLLSISTYGFRGEALATISEVSKFTIQTKQKDSPIATQLIKIENDIYLENIPFDLISGCTIYVQDIFFNTPARHKFLKSAATEWSYIYNIFIDYALSNYNIHFKIVRDGKTILDLSPKDSVLGRIFQIYKKDWENNILDVQEGNDQISIIGAISDSGLTFLNQDNIKIFVNNRPVNDRIIKKALMQSYNRQLPNGQYPFAVLFVQLKSDMLDINVHPRKSQVRFMDPGSVFNFVYMSINNSLGNKKLIGGSFGKKDNYINTRGAELFNGFKEQIKYLNPSPTSEKLPFDFEDNITVPYDNSKVDNNINLPNNYKIIGQIWDSFIIVESDNDLLLVDQHALAERIKYEQIKKSIKLNGNFQEMLLTPVSYEFPLNIDLDDRISELNKIGFDISKISDTKVVLYSLPKVFLDYKVDTTNLLSLLISLDEFNMENLLDSIFATKACKSSIKAGQKLSTLEMHQLIKDGFENIDKLFVCQHGRPSIVKISKTEIIGLFDRV